MAEHAEPTREPRAEASEVTVARAALVQALRGLELGERDSMEQLHRTLCDFVGVMRKAGRSCDDVVGDVRALVTKPVTEAGARKVPPIAREALVELSLRWCADEYARPEGN